VNHRDRVVGRRQYRPTVERAGDHLVQRAAVGVARAAEDAGRHAELERDHPVGGEYDDAVYGPILAYSGFRVDGTAAVRTTASAVSWITPSECPAVTNSA
jgi:hypothetical protein